MDIEQVLDWDAEDTLFPFDGVESCMPDWWIPPYGSTIDIGSFRLLPPLEDTPTAIRLWTSAPLPDGTQDEYLIALEDLDEAICFRNGTQVTPNDLQDYFCRPGPTQKLWYWIDWVMRRDAKEQLASTRKLPAWEGDTLEARLMRVEMGIVMYDVLERDLSEFTVPAQLQELLDRMCESTPARFTVHELPMMIVPDDDDHLWDSPVALQTVNTGPDGRLIDRFLPGVVHTAMAAEGFYRQIEEIMHRKPSISLDARLEGQEVQSAHGFGVVLPDRLEEVLADQGLDLRADPNAFDDEDPRWWLLHLEGLDAMLAFPKQGSAIRVQIDNDGSAIDVTIQPVQSALRHAIAQEQFNRRWGRWLDEDAPLTPDELSAGSASVTAQFAELLDRERETAHQHGETEQE